MKIITRQTLANEAYSEYMEWQQQRDRTRGYPDRAEELLALGDSPCPDDVDRVMGSGTWTTVRWCHDCDAKDLDLAIELGSHSDDEYGPCHYCRDCIAKALEEMTPLDPKEMVEDRDKALAMLREEMSNRDAALSLASEEILNLLAENDELRKAVLDDRSLERAIALLPISSPTAQLVEELFPGTWICDLSEEDARSMYPEHSAAPSESFMKWFRGPYPRVR